MKKQVKTNQLAIHKKTIATLNSSALNEIKGGNWTTLFTITDKITNMSRDTICTSDAM